MGRGHGGKAHETTDYFSYLIVVYHIADACSFEIFKFIGYLSSRKTLEPYQFWTSNEIMSLLFYCGLR